LTTVIARETNAAPWLRLELRELARLAMPLIAASAGTQLMSLVDTALVGRLGSDALGGVGVANGLFFTLTVFGIGCVAGMDAPVAQALGAGERARARRTLREGARVALLTGLPIMVLAALSPLLLAPLGVDPATANETRRYLWARIPGVWPLLLFFAARSYLQAHGTTRPIVIAMVVENVVNIVGNVLLIWGDAGLERLGLPKLGVPALGVLGSGLATSFATVVALVVLAWAIRLSEEPDGAAKSSDPELFRTILRLGTPLGLQYLAEVGIFALASVLAGRMGASAAAGHNVAITLASFTFCVALGISAAAAVRVGHAVGRGDQRGVRRAGAVALGAALSFMTLSATAFTLFAPELARVVTDDPKVVAAATPLIGIAAFFQLSDGAQATGAGLLRGIGDARAPLYANVAGHYLVGLPLLLLLGLGLGLGAPGLWWGLSAGLTAVAIALVARFVSISRRPIARV
jgi:MATE family multidrug resistance protein